MSGVEDTPSSAPSPTLSRGAHVLRWVLGGLALLFGTGTVLMGGHVLFGGEAAREEAGAVVTFVLVFNFTAGFAYLASGALTLASRRASLPIARALAALTLLVFAAFGAHVASGGAYETRTLMAMALRSAFWVAQALLLPRVLPGVSRR